jgi:hypothetical protein
MSLTELALLDGRMPLPLWDVIGLTLTFTLTLIDETPHISVRYRARSQEYTQVFKKCNFIGLY